MAVRNRQMMHADALIDSLWRRVERQDAEITRLRTALQQVAKTDDPNDPEPDSENARDLWKLRQIARRALEQSAAGEAK